MTPVNFPNPPVGCTHEVRSSHDGGLLFFFNESTGRLYDTEHGRWLTSVFKDVPDLELYGDCVYPLNVELENK